MKSLLFVLIITSISFFSLDAQMTLNGVTLPAELSVNSQELELNGGGIRTKYFFKLYTIGLYLSDKNSDGNAIAKADETMVLRFEITSKMIDSDNMTDAINEGFGKSTGGNMAPIQDRINQTLKNFSNEKIKIGDVFDIQYIPGVGIKIFKNNTFKSTITGLDFKQALFGIWLSDNPIDKGLKKDMLGK